MVDNSTRVELSTSMKGGERMGLMTIFPNIDITREYVLANGVKCSYYENIYNYTGSIIHPVSRFGIRGQSTTWFLASLYPTDHYWAWTGNPGWSNFGHSVVTSTRVIDGVLYYYSIGTDNIDIPIEPFIANSLEEAWEKAIEELGGAARKWNIQYVPINCELAGPGLENQNTSVTVNITPYPNSELVGVSVYYSSGAITYTQSNDTITFTTPTFT